MDHSETKERPKVDHTPAELSDTAKRLLKAAQLIEERGHCRGRAESRDGSLCVIAALTHADYALGGDAQSAPYWTTVKQLRAYLRTAGIVAWSDSAPTSEVLSKLRAAALES